MTSSPGTPAPARSFVERLLRPVAEVRAGEGAVVLLMALNLFLVLSAYYMLKTVREALILTEVSAAVKTYASAGQALLLLVLVPAFGAFASRVNRLKLLTWVTVFFVANILVFFLLGRTGAHLGVVFFIWVGIFNVMAISQFWAFANDIYTPEQGKRLLAVVGVGSSLGAWVGSEYASRFGRVVGPYNLMLIAAGVLLLCVAVTRIVNARQIRQTTAAKAAEAEQPLGKEGGFELIRKDRYLMLIAALIVVLNVVNTTGEYLLSSKAQQEAGARFGTDEASRGDRQKFMSGFYGDFFGWVNLLGFLAQIFAVSRVIKVLGVGGALFVHPVIALLGYTSMIWAPSLAPGAQPQDRRQRHRLLAQQHGETGALAPHESGGQVQGQASGGLLLLARGRRALGRGRLRGRKPDLRGARLCRRQRGLRPRLALHRVEAREREQAPHGGRHGGLGTHPAGWK